MIVAGIDDALMDPRQLAASFAPSVGAARTAGEGPLLPPQLAVVTAGDARVGDELAVGRHRQRLHPEVEADGSPCMRQGIHRYPQLHTQRPTLWHPGAGCR